MSGNSFSLANSVKELNVEDVFFGAFLSAYISCSVYKFVDNYSILNNMNVLVSMTALFGVAIIYRLFNKGIKIWYQIFRIIGVLTTSFLSVIMLIGSYSENYSFVDSIMLLIPLVIWIVIVEYRLQGHFS